MHSHIAIWDAARFDRRVGLSYPVISMIAKRSSKAPIIIAGAVGLIAIAIAAWARPFPFMGDRALLESSASVELRKDSLGFSFIPRGNRHESGLIFYCGARVPPEAYAYLARACAEAGFTAILPNLPLDLAVFAPDRADEVVAAFPTIRRWVVGGHSLGGVMASTWAAKRGAAGLVLLASYPGGGVTLASASFPVLSISASKDGLATPTKIVEAQKFLPALARYVEIGGGNHAQFGEYGPQDGDNSADIPGSAQRAAVVEEVLGLLTGIEAAAGKQE